MGRSNRNNVGRHRSNRADRLSEQLLGVVRQLSYVYTLEEVTTIVRRAVHQLTGTDGATFVLRERNLVHYVDEDAIDPLWKGHRFDIHACISGWSILNRKAAAIEDIYLDPRIPIESYRTTFVKSLVMVPIRSEDPWGPSVRTGPSGEDPASSRRACYKLWQTQRRWPSQTSSTGKRSTSLTNTGPQRQRLGC